MGTENRIDYHLLVQAIDYYKSNGFKYLDLDWTIPESISSITKPADKKDYLIENKALVASAEQSFLDMIINSNLKKGKYCGLTPCFRDEEALDYIHQRYFMKVELIDTLNVNEKSLKKILGICLQFFNQKIRCDIVKTEFGYDIIDSKNGIELGSYGIRKIEKIEWIFATGLAEPRFSNAKRLLRN